MEHEDVVAHFGGLADDHAHAVVDEEAPADLGGRMDLDARGRAGGLGQRPGGELVARVPQAVRGPVGPQRVHARVEQRDLQARAGGRVPASGGGQVFPGQVDEGPVRVVHGCPR